MRKLCPKPSPGRAAAARRSVRHNGGAGGKQTIQNQPATTHPRAAPPPPSRCPRAGPAPQPLTCPSHAEPPSRRRSRGGHVLAAPPGRSSGRAVRTGRGGAGSRRPLCCSATAGGDPRPQAKRRCSPHQHHITAPRRGGPKCSPTPGQRVGEQSPFSQRAPGELSAGKW